MLVLFQFKWSDSKEIVFEMHFDVALIRIENSGFLNAYIYIFHYYSLVGNKLSLVRNAWFIFLYA